MFLLKKLLSRFLFPLPLCAGILLLGWGLWSFTRWKKLGRGLVLAGALLLLVFSYPWLPRLALGHLESHYPALGSRQSSVISRQPRFIMVLGAGFSGDAHRQPAARFGDEALKRIVEGVRLHRLLTNSSLLVSVPGSAVSQVEKGRVLGELLQTFGLQTHTVQVCATARDTAEEIAWCGQAVGTNSVIVVSSASHLPRAMLIARKQGLHAIPAPSGYLVDPATPSSFNQDRVFPSSVNLYNSERAMNEYLGLAWERMRGGTLMTDD